MRERRRERCGETLSFLFSVVVVVVVDRRLSFNPHGHPTEIKEHTQDVRP